MNIASVSEVVSKLKQQQYKCCLTGWDLEPNNFCLDHIVPISDGGDDSIGNLDCVHPKANSAKGTMSKDEFIELCIAVADHCRCHTG